MAVDIIPTTQATTAQIILFFILEKTLQNKNVPWILLLKVTHL